MYFLDSLEACNPAELPREPGIRVEVGNAKGDNGCVVYANTRIDLIQYVMRHWGTDDPQWFDEHVIARIEEGEGTVRESGSWFDPDDFLRLVEDQWTLITKGEICISNPAPWSGYGDDDIDLPLQSLVHAMHAEAREYVDMAGSAQVDENGNDIEGSVSDLEMASRIARALSILHFGS